MSKTDWRNLDGIPLRDGEPVFEEPWQAQAFAMAVALNEQGMFEWTNWAEAFGANIASAPDTPYWSHWMTTLEGFLARHSIASAEQIEKRTQEWHEAAARTPHGEPIALSKSMNET